MGRKPVDNRMLSTTLAQTVVLLAFVEPNSTWKPSAKSLCCWLFPALVICVLLHWQFPDLPREKQKNLSSGN